MEKKQQSEQVGKIVKYSLDGEEWFEVSELLALCAINEHYASKDLDSVLERYNKGHIIPVEFILYKNE